MGVDVGVASGMGVGAMVAVGGRGVGVGATVVVGKGDGSRVEIAVAVELVVGAGAMVVLPPQARVSARNMRVSENVAIRMGLLRAARLGACHSCLPSTCIAQRRHKSQPLTYTSSFWGG